MYPQSVWWLNIYEITLNWVWFFTSDTGGGAFIPEPPQFPSKLLSNEQRLSVRTQFSIFQLGAVEVTNGNKHGYKSSQVGI